MFEYIATPIVVPFDLVWFEEDCFILFILIHIVRHGLLSYEGPVWR